MISQIEDAVLNRIRLAQDTGVLGYAFADLDSYSAQIDESVIEELANRTPAAWVVWGGDVVVRTHSGKRQMRGTFVVMCAARSLRNNTVARHGTGIDVGAYQLAQDIVGLVDGRKLDLDLTQAFTLVDRRTVFSKAVKRQHLAVYAITFDCGYMLPRYPDELEDFTSIAGDWQLPDEPDKPEPVTDYVADPTDPTA